MEGVTGCLKLGGQVVMRRAAANQQHLLLYQKLGWQLTTLPPATYTPKCQWQILFKYDGSK